MSHNRPRVTLRVALVLVACVAVNFWLFRLSILLGIVGLNLTKHLLIAALCRQLGVNRDAGDVGTHPRHADLPATTSSPN